MNDRCDLLDVLVEQFEGFFGGHGPHEQSQDVRGHDHFHIAHLAQKRPVQTLELLSVFALEIQHLQNNTTKSCNQK